MALASGVGEVGRDLLALVAARTPEGDTRRGIERARELDGSTVAEAARVLGDGSKVIASDTVPFALFCAAKFRDSYEEAIWGTLDGLEDPQSDRDTILAIVGGIVALSTKTPIPDEWKRAREPLP